MSTTTEAYLGPLDLIVTDMTTIFDSVGAQVGDVVSTRSKFGATTTPSDFSTETGLDDLEVFAQRTLTTGLLGFGDTTTQQAYELLHEGRVADGSKLLKVAGKGLIGLGVFTATSDGPWGAVAGLLTFDGMMLKNIAEELEKKKAQQKRDQASVTVTDRGVLVAMKSSNPFTPQFGDPAEYPMDNMYEYEFLISGNSVAIVPEPTSLTLLGLGIASVVGFAWRSRKQSHGRSAI